MTVIQAYPGYVGVVDVNDPPAGIVVLGVREKDADLNFHIREIYVAVPTQIERVEERCEAYNRAVMPHLAHLCPFSLKFAWLKRERCIES